MRERSRLLVAGLAVAVLAALAVFAVVLVDAHRSSRDDIEGRLEDRAMAGATLIGSLFGSSGETSRRQLAERYGGPRVSVARLTRQAQEGHDVFRVVTTAAGRPLARVPGTPDAVLRAIATRPEWFRIGITGRIGASSVRNTALPGTLTFAQAFTSRAGTRVMVWGARPATVAPLLAGSLERLPAVRGGETYLLDADGRVIVTPDAPARYGQPAPDVGLVAALGRDGRSGDLPAGRFYATSDIPGVPWRIVLTAPRDELFASISGLKRWGPWALFAAFAVAALAAIALVARSFRDADAVARANTRLEQSNAALAERAGELSHANRRLADLNAELEQSNAELDRFASIASHDLREPLRKVQMFSERVIHHEGPNLSPRGRDYLERMDAAARRMQALIDGLLEYARASTHTHPVEELDLDALAQDVVEDLDALRRESGGDVVLEPLPRLVADPLRMRQLLQNLIANGLRFRREDVPSVVRVSGSVVDDETAEIVVADNGIGFDAHHADRVFELFERLHPRGAYPGTGMGLALCRRIVEAHGGTITVASAPGEGSTFTVRLPLAPPPAAADAPPDAAEEHHVPS